MSVEAGSGGGSGGVAEDRGVAWPSWFESAPRLELPAGDQLARVLAGDRPVVFAGAASAWPAVRTWSAEHLAERFGAGQVDALMDLPSTGVLFPREQAAYQRSLTFADFLAHMMATPASRPCYLAYTRTRELLRELERDYDFQSLSGASPDESDTRAWIGSAGTRSMLHSDLQANLFAQIWGRKAACFVEFAESHRVYPFDDNVTNSQVDPDAIDAARFPAFRRARVYATILEPGDVAFIPRGCWHYLRSLEPSISLNHWWGPPLEARNYLKLVAKLGPACWWATARDFVRHGVLRRKSEQRFFFSPPSTGSRLFDLVARGDFNHANHPQTD